MRDIKKQPREDYNLGFILQYENVAWFDEECGEVRILDRRIYPEKKDIWKLQRPFPIW